MVVFRSLTRSQTEIISGLCPFGRTCGFDAQSQAALSSDYIYLISPHDPDYKPQSHDFCYQVDILSQEGLQVYDEKWCSGQF